MDSIKYKTDNAILALLLEQQEIEEVKQEVGLVSNGDGYETHSGKLFTTDDIITLRDKATIGLGSTKFTGIVAKKYDGLNDGHLVFDADGYARVGDPGSLQMIATREDAPLTNGIAFYDNSTRKFKTKAESSLSVGYADNANKLDNIEASRYLRNDINNPKLSVTGGLIFTLEADTNSSNESNNVALILSQDGGGNTASLGLNSSNDLYLHHGSTQVFKYDEGEDDVIFNSTVHSSAKFNKHAIFSPDTPDDVLNLRRYGANHTLLNMMSPPQKSWGGAKECTLALVRGDGNEYFMDIYNMDYGDADAGNYLDYGDARMGIRLQKRGMGHYTPFNIEYSEGAEEFPALTILPNGTDSTNKTSVEVNRLLANYDTVRRFETTALGTLTTGESLIDGVIKNKGTFIDGFSGEGFNIGYGSGKADATFDNLTVRKGAKFYELMIQKIRTGNGSYWFSDGAKVVRISDETVDYYTLELDKELGNPFLYGQKLRCQVWNGSGVKFYEGVVSWAGNTAYPNYINLRKSDFVGDRPTPGDEIVRISGGAVYVTSNDNESPYLDVVYDMSTKVRLGKLTGINDTDFGGALTGYGLYGDNVYLKGIMKLSAGSSISFSDVVGGQDKIDAVQGDAERAIVNAGLAQTKANSAYTLADTKITSEQATTITQNTVTASYINAFELTATKGTVGGFTISANRISTTNVAWGSATSGFWLSSSEREMMLYKSTSEYIKMYYTNDNDWGIYGRDASGSVLRLGAVNQIAHWNFDTSYIWSGTKQVSNAYSISGMTLASAGAIRTKEFRVDTDGSAHFKGILDAPSGNIGGWTINPTAITSADGVISMTGTSGAAKFLIKTKYKNASGTLLDETSSIDKDGFHFNGLSDKAFSMTSTPAKMYASMSSVVSDYRMEVGAGVTSIYAKGTNGYESKWGWAIVSDGYLRTNALQFNTRATSFTGTSTNPFRLDTLNYGYFSIYTNSGGQYCSLGGGRTGQIVYIWNRNDNQSFEVCGVVGDDSFTIAGGQMCAFMYDDNYRYNFGGSTASRWVRISQYDSN
ncbi:hypothetical protein [Labilibaculum euxinus]